MPSAPMLSRVRVPFHAWSSVIAVLHQLPQAISGTRSTVLLRHQRRVLRHQRLVVDALARKRLRAVVMHERGIGDQQLVAVQLGALPVVFVLVVPDAERLVE